MDFPLLLVTLVTFATAAMAGAREYGRLAARYPDFKLEVLHRKPGMIRWVLLSLTFLTAIGLFVAFQRIALYRIPAWLDLSLYYIAHGFSAALFGILGGLGWSAGRREKKSDSRALVLTTSLCLAALLTCQFTMLRYVANRVSDCKFSGAILLQTSSSSCAAASGANVAGLLGLHYSERDMAQLMGTRACGTSPAGIIRGLQKAGLKARLFEQNPAQPSMPLPAILFVFHPGLGSESHAVAAVRWLPNIKALEVWDPLSGKTVISQAVLPELWEGRGVAVWK